MISSVKVVYEKLLAKNVTYTQDLLQLVSKWVMDKYGSSLPNRGGVPANPGLFPKTEIDAQFGVLLEKAMERAEDRKSASKQPSQFWETKKGQDLIKNRGATPDIPSSVKESTSSTTPKDEDTTTPSSPGGATGSSKRLSKVELAAQKRAQRAAEKAQKGDAKVKSPVWNKDAKVSIKDIDKSGQADVPLSGSSTGEDQVDVHDMQFEDEESDNDSDTETYEGEESDSNVSRATSSSTSSGSGSKASSSDPSTSGGGFGLLKFIKGLTQKELTEENLRPVMEDIRAHLIAKNVATDIAESICDSVSQSLVGRTHGNFKSISATVKAAMSDALTRILTPKRHIDISREIQTAKDAGRPYSIVFVGVNGVGKSTSLAKVCAWLLKQNHRVMIAACDTFRSGAVEQLKVHASALGGVPIFDQGYGKDAAYIAQQAIAKANTEAIDVVLIDTAGRMQDNEPLMAALAKLVKVNKPDLILFVGEALVGNASVDQLTKFNRAFEEYGDISTPRTIDGILLTKFDTVDDKVGAAISMVYTTGQPIVFVGVGQKYTDIRTLNVKKIVDILAKGRSE